MKMLNAVAFAATLLTGNVFAGDHAINVVGRANWNYVDNDSAAVSNSSSFNVDYLKTIFSGAVTPSVKYFVATDLLSANSGTDDVDKTSLFVDEAFVTKTFTSGTAISFGKKAVLIGGRETDYVAYDLYSVSAFNDSIPDNQVGLTVAQEIAGNTFMAQYFNGNKNNGQAHGTNAQSKFGYAVGWYGNILNDMIKPIVAYTVVPKAASVDRVNKGDDTYLGAGLQFNLPMGLTLEGDYDLFTQKDAAGTVTAKRDLKTTSIVGLLRYSTARCAPFVKFISDTNKLQSTKTASRIAYDVGVEFKEAKDDMIRYHVVYSGSTVKTGIDTGTTVKTSPSSILVGLKFDAAILK